MTDTSSRPATAPVALRDGSPTLDLPAELPTVYDKPRRPIATWTPERLAEVHKIVARTPKLDGRAVNGFGVEVQREANTYLDELLQSIGTDDVGVGGDLVAEVATGVQMIDIDGLKREAEGHKSLPVKVMPGLGSAKAGLLGFVGQYVSAFQRFRARSKQIVAHFDKIESGGRREMATLEAYDGRLETLVDKNLKSLRRMEETLAAGEIILYRERERYAADRTAALETRDPAELVAVRDHGEQINAFESRLLRIDTGVVNAMVSVPRTRLTQSAARIRYRNVLDTILYDLPMMKSAIIRLAALKSIREAEAGIEARQALRKKLEGIEVDALGHAYEAAKRTEAGALTEIDELAGLCTKVLGIIDKGAEIDAENRASRQEARERLTAVRHDFVEGLREVTARTVEANAP